MGIGHVRTILEATDVEWRTPTNKLVSVVVAFAADKRGICRSTQDEVAQEVGVSPRQVANAIDEMCEAHVLVRLGHGRYGVRYGLGPGDLSEQGPPVPKGANAEFLRLREIVKAEKAAGKQLHGIQWNKQGMPVLVER